MKIQMEAPVNAQGDAAHLDQPGKYHCMVKWIEEEPRKADGTMIDNAIFRVHATVLDGNVPNQGGKELALMFFNPKMTDKDQGEMARAKVRNFAMAIECCSIANGQMTIDFGPVPGAPDYNAADEHIGSLYANGRQFVVELEKDRDGKFLSLRYSNVWHVDHPAVKDVPKDKSHLALLPPALRKSAKDFAKPDNIAKPETKVAETAAAGTAAAGTVAGGVTVDEI